MNFLLLLALWPGLPDIQAPGGGKMTVEMAPRDRVKVSSPYWRVEFDLRNGGSLDTIVFPHGSGANLLVKPFATYVDQWSDRDAPAVEARSSEQGGVLRLEFSGRMAGAGRAAGPIEFETVWTLSPFVVRADQKLRFTEDAQVRTVGIGSAAVRADLDEWALRVGPTDDPDRRKMAPARFGKLSRAGELLFSERHAPSYMLLFDRGKEGFDVNVASDLAAWETGLTGRGGVGRFEARVAGDGRSVEMLREPLHAPTPMKVAKGEYLFSYYLGLPRIVEKADRKWMHLSFGNHPWPSDQEIAAWAEAGVNIVRLHNDYAADENFWHDGAWPPYDEAGMAEVKRIVAACHRHKIAVVPYFSIHEFHPVAQGYAENENEWKRSNDQAGTVYHNHVGKGEFGAQMCPQSKWLDRRKADIEKAYRELGFDGIYYDWVMTLPCNNKAHNEKLHLGTDGVIDLLAWTRRLVAPNGTLILHLYGAMPSIAFENFADLVVNMEEVSGAEQMMTMDRIPIVTTLAESIARSPCPSYRKDRERERNRNNIAHLAVLGMFPWSGSAGTGTAGGTGGATYEETLKLFRAFKPYPLAEYRFHDALSGAVRTSWEDVYGAVYGARAPAVVVISNAGPAMRKNVLWRVKPETLGLGDAARLELNDIKTGRKRTLSVAELGDGSLLTDLEPYEYRLYEIRGAP
ncbi:MAG: hypothetical protein KIT09_11265 [Bryobacteraceae bacterium]|nr:hypothetical protein [Bryobacteraceae bacterium]